MLTSTPTDPSQKIPPEARGRVRRKKKASAGAAGRGVSAPSSNKGSGGGGGGMTAGDSVVEDRTFVTNREFGEGGEFHTDESEQPV